MKNISKKLKTVFTPSPKFKKIDHQKGITNIVIIVVGLILCAVLLGFLNNGINGGTRKSTWDFLFKKNSGEQSAIFSCGISVLTPRSYEEISFPLSFSGFVGGCGWAPEDGSVGSVILFDATNRAIASERLYASGIYKNKPIPFSGLIGDARPLTTNGYLLFIASSYNQSKEPKSYKVPVYFKK